LFLGSETVPPIFEFIGVLHFPFHVWNIISMEYTPKLFLRIESVPEGNGEQTANMLIIPLLPQIGVSCRDQPLTSDTIPGMTEGPYDQISN